jgi:hypothetical protein
MKKIRIRKKKDLIPEFNTKKISLSNSGTILLGEEGEEKRMIGNQQYRNISHLRK